MLNDILKKDNIVKLLKEICTNNRYNKKDSNETINYEQFPLFSQSLFIVVDAIYKYCIIINEDYLLDSYIEEIDLLFKKVSDISEINIGINRLIGKFTGLKLGHKNYLDKKNQILKYIYDKYITEGYIFHAISSCYIDEILQKGFVPQQYNNLYDRFNQIKQILKDKDIINTDFESKSVSFTDSFLMAYYYAISSPMYFSNLIIDNKYIKSINEKSVYFKNDYDLSLKNLNKLILNLDLNTNEANLLRDTFTEEWNLLDKTNSYPAIMMVKRKLILDNEDFNYVVDENISFDDSICQIFSNRYNNIICDKKIDKENIEIIKLYGYNDFVKINKNQLEEVNDEEENVIDEYGKASIIMLVGSLLITLGVIITIIMIVG